MPRSDIPRRAYETLNVLMDDPTYIKLLDRVTNLRLRMMSISASDLRREAELAYMVAADELARYVDMHIYPVKKGRQ